MEIPKKSEKVCTELVNVRTEEYDVYIGRSKNGKDMITAEPGERGWLGNPYKIKEHGGDYRRHESLEKFTYLLREKLKDSEFREKFKELKGKKLGRWCSPDEDCHGEVIIEELEKLDC